jgi:hypothetical protein
MRLSPNIKRAIISQFKSGDPIVYLAKDLRGQAGKD